MQTSYASRRLGDIPESIFATMSRLAAQHRAVNLGQGFPDFDGPQWIKSAALRAMEEGKNQYAPMPGTLGLRRAVASYHEKYYGLLWDPETEITVTAGATESLFSSMLALLDASDEVILFEPYYDSYHANVLLAGARARFVTLHKPDFHFDAAELQAAVTDSTKMIVVNNPHNPTGRVFTRQELMTIASVAERHDLLVLSDEVYEFLTYDDRQHIPFASLHGMRARTMTVSSTGKTFGMTGWKIGYTIACPGLTSAVRMVHQFATFAVNTPGQHAMAQALGRLESWLPGFRELYLRKRDLLFDGLKDTVFTPHLPDGSYFMMVDIPEDAAMDDVELATKLVTDHGVAVIPPSVFYGRSGEGRSMLRLCFAKEDETLLAGIEKLRGFGT